MALRKDKMEELFVKYWDGAADVAEKLLLLDWLKQSDENRKAFSQAYDIWLAASLGAENELTTSIALDRFKSRVINSEKYSRKNTKLVRYRLQIAASFLLVIFSLGYYISRKYIQMQQPMVINQVIMPEGSKGNVVLPDGSLVWLKSNTKIVYPETFSDKVRAVKVFGEAYFEVVPNKQKPFIVNADQLAIKVLGTKFNVRNYNERDDITVTLLEGRVSLLADSFTGEHFLLPNQQFVLNKKNLSTKLKKVRAETSVSWIKDRLVFENKPLSEIIPYMEAWYGVDIMCDKTIANQTRLTFTIRNESLSEIMKSIQFVSSLKFQQKDNVLFINK